MYTWKIKQGIYTRVIRNTFLLYTYLPFLTTFSVPSGRYVYTTRIRPLPEITLPVLPGTRAWTAVTVSALSRSSRSCHIVWITGVKQDATFSHDGLLFRKRFATRALACVSIGVCRVVVFSCQADVPRFTPILAPRIAHKPVIFRITNDHNHMI